MTDPEFDQMNTEASNDQSQIQLIDNVSEPQATPQFIEPADTVTPDATPLSAPQPQPPAPTTAPAPRTVTPSRAVNGTLESTTPMPTKAASHGAPARRYLNEKVTGTLLEGMKRLAAEQPDMPLRVLGEFLIQKSAELESKPT